MDHAICAICREVLGGDALGVTLNCGHRFHAECLGQWRQRNNTCPFDRLPITEMLFDPTELRERVVPLLIRRRQLTDLLAPYQRPTPKGPLAFLLRKQLHARAPADLLHTKRELARTHRKLRAIPLVAQFQAQDLVAAGDALPVSVETPSPPWSLWGAAAMIAIFFKWTAFPAQQ